ncbi:MAG: hypothetical protein RBT38_13130 [Bacteroidales bacterium]|jgi:hypothetical protein|nr:hypothetical protein [Bacteroidales bacterium]
MDKQDETRRRGVMGWYVGLQVIILSALPRDIDQETAEYWMDNGDLLEKRLREALNMEGTIEIGFIPGSLEEKIKAQKKEKE